MVRTKIKPDLIILKHVTCFSVPVKKIEAVLGGVAELPCNALPQDAHDDVYLILWFKDDARKPMYSLDVRGKPLSQAEQWPDASNLGKRASFKTTSPNSLVVKDLTLQVSRP